MNDDDEYRFATYDPDTCRNIAQFQERPDPALVPPILRGIVQYYLPKETALTADSILDQPLTSMGLDSLTLMEITLDLQDAFGIELSDEELKNLQSFSEISSLLDQKVKALSRGQA
jgi:acyl carrier protein